MECGRHLHLNVKIARRRKGLDCAIGVGHLFSVDSGVAEFCNRAERLSAGSGRVADDLFGAGTTQLPWLGSFPSGWASSAVEATGLRLSCFA